MVAATAAVAVASILLAPAPIMREAAIVAAAAMLEAAAEATDLVRALQEWVSVSAWVWRAVRIRRRVLRLRQPL